MAGLSGQDSSQRIYRVRHLCECLVALMSFSIGVAVGVVRWLQPLGRRQEEGQARRWPEQMVRLTAGINMSWILATRQLWALNCAIVLVLLLVFLHCVLRCTHTKICCAHAPIARFCLWGEERRANFGENSPLEPVGIQLIGRCYSFCIKRYYRFALFDLDVSISFRFLRSTEFARRCASFVSSAMLMANEAQPSFVQRRIVAPFMAVLTSGEVFEASQPFFMFYFLARGDTRENCVKSMCG